MKKAITWILIILVLGGAVGGFLWFRNRQQQAADVVEVLRTGETVLDTLELSVSASGNVIVEDRVDLSFESAGIVDAVNVKVGDRVTAGDILATLDDDSLLDAVTQAELELAQAKLSLQQADKPVDEDDLVFAERAIAEAVQAMRIAGISAELAEVRASIDQTRAAELEEDLREAYEDTTELLDKYGQPQSYGAGITAAYMEAEGNVSITALRSEYAIEQANSQWMAANQRYAKATRDLELLQEGPDETQIQQLELQVEQTEISLTQARADLASARLVAPFDGVVSAVNLQAGTPAPAMARPAVTLLDDSALYVDLTIDEIDIGLIDIDQLVVLTLDAYPETDLTGTIDRVGLLPDLAGGVIAYPVRVHLDDAAAKAAGVQIRDGMTASARITIGQIDDVVLIPNWAIRTDQDTEEIIAYCYCLDSGTPQRAILELGASNETWTEVVSGIEAGATVALVSEEFSLFEMGGPPPGMRR